MGDLISRQEALKTYQNIVCKGICCADCRAVDRDGNCAVEDWLKALPSAQPEQQWIPCSERLPKLDDYRECNECWNGTVWYITEKGTIGLGYYYGYTKQWFTIGDLETDGKVVAWMSLPEQWKGKE